MNQNTKKSLVFALLPIAALVIGIVALFVIGYFFTSPTPEVDPEAPGTAFGAFFVTIGNAIIMLLIASFDILLTSIAVYVFAYYSRKYAQIAIEELTSCGESIKHPKALKIISLVEMILSAIAAIAIGLVLIAILTFM